LVFCQGMRQPIDAAFIPPPSAKGHGAVAYMPTKTVGTYAPPAGYACSKGWWVCGFAASHPR
jgi:hypothetical protein